MHFLVNVTSVSELLKEILKMSFLGEVCSHFLDGIIDIQAQKSCSLVKVPLQVCEQSN